MSISNRTSNALLVLSVLVLAAVTINLFVPIVPRGEWRDAAVGINLGQLALVDPLSGDSIDFQHPALLYFFRDDCRFCPHSARRLIRYAGEAASESRVYAITSDSTADATSVRSAGIQVARLGVGAPALRFVTQVPMFVSTDASGVVHRVFVGIPGRRAWTELIDDSRKSGPARGFAQ